MAAEIRYAPEGLEASIDYRFSERALLARALTHRSAAPADQHMERLEFLGDAVLGLVISEYLHDAFPDKPEGDLSRMRSILVRRQGLLAVAECWHLERYLRVGDSERLARGGGIKSPSIMANAVEALIGAVFKDGGWDEARRVVRRAWQTMLDGIGEIETLDAKSRLQELTQARDWGLPEYELIDRGAAATPRFEASCRVRGELLGRGKGERKKLAETRAAEQAYRKLNHE